METHQNKKPWLHGISNSVAETPFDDSHASIVTKIASGSPASELDIKPNDYLVTIDNKYSSSIKLEEYLPEKTGTVTYLFYNSQKKMYTEIKTDTTPLGILLESTTVGIVNRYKTHGFDGWEEFDLLWSREAWDALETLCDEATSDGLFTRIIRLFKKYYGESAEILYRGAVFFEKGDPQQGMNYIGRFINTQMRSHVTSLHTIAYFYAALWAKMCDDENEYQRWLQLADRYNRGRFDRVTREVVANAKFSIAVAENWVHEPFPVMYELPLHEGEHGISLKKALAQLDDNMLQPICMLPWYRSNGPYNDIMLSYRGMYNSVKDIMAPLHVLLQPTGYSHDYWLENETKIREEGIPLVLLEDAEDHIGETLDQPCTPLCYVLNKEGTIVYEGSLDNHYEFWHAASMGKM